MASVSFTQFLSVPRWHSNWPFFLSPNVVIIRDLRLERNWSLKVMSKNNSVDSLAQEPSNEDGIVKKTSKTSKKAPSRGRKKPMPETPQENSESTVNGVVPQEDASTSVSSSAEESKKAPRRTRRKVVSNESMEEEIVEEKDSREREAKRKVDTVVETEISESSGVSRRRGRRSKKKVDDLGYEVNDAEISDGEVVSRQTRSKKNVDDVVDQVSEGEASDGEGVRRRRRARKKVANVVDQVSKAEVSDNEGVKYVADLDDENDEELELGKDGDDDISDTYSWPPLVCCFGAAQHAFVPSGRPANRLINYEIHDRMRDALWEPERFVRAPGGSSSSVAIALANLGGRVAFMGKVGNDDYGRAIVCYLNTSKVQTRGVVIDGKRTTAVSQMKISKRGGLRMTCLRACGEDSLTKSEINIDMLREAKMFYFNTSSLLERSMRSTTMRAIKISKKLGGVVFYDVNLPLPLWQSGDETKMFIQQAWNLSDVIEITKQELELLCGIKPSEEFDTRNNNKSKFVHYDPEVIAPLWHDNLKVLFVTNGTSKVHYYTKEHNGAVVGTEDAPLTPFTCDMSASGDAIVAALMRMLTVQPHLITDKGYLEHTIKYAIDSGIVDQWALARTRGFPPKDDMEGVVPDQNGIRSITEVEYRTLAPVLE
ncbi:Carbohydrate kinase PfkB [Dillenia turbinata]|uniref:Carbohydrate kinase PfkB n=1 Tax=Dillenia turbinata TaxID=194707 RepID=A0AAN8VPA8_9MAGN